MFYGLRLFYGLFLRRYPTITSYTLILYIYKYYQKYAFLDRLLFSALDNLIHCIILYIPMGYTKEQEKLDILTRDFEKLEENWKEYIRELTQKLVDIHCGGELMGINAVIDSVSI